MSHTSSRNIYIGIGLAVLATFIWSGNFVVARVVIKEIPPVSLSFYRWLFAALILFPFAYKQFKKEWNIIKQSWQYLFWVALSGIALFNTFVYVGGHYTSAINLALIGTTSSPIMANILARIFLKEKIGWYKIVGIALCITGVLFLLVKGDFRNLLTFQFSEGDLWVLLAAFCFAVYNTLVRKKPVAISAPSFLLAVFSLGTLLLFPFFLWEHNYSQPIVWSMNLVWVIAYLSIGASVICFWIWNISIQKLGAGRTALFGNLIPIFSSIEAVLWLHERFTFNHVISMTVVLTGLVIANLPLFFRKNYL
jgi:drug/metabolite transporter (DMT)-like permease